MTTATRDIASLIEDLDFIPKLDEDEPTASDSGQGDEVTLHLTHRDLIFCNANLLEADGTVKAVCYPVHYFMAANVTLGMERTCELCLLGFIVLVIQNVRSYIAMNSLADTLADLGALKENPLGKHEVSMETLQKVLDSALYASTKFKHLWARADELFGSYLDVTAVLESKAKE